MKRKTGQQDTTGLRIGAVSRITNVPVDTLRAWERRYEVVSPRRTETATRLYSEEDVERLKLIKRLIGHGHAIGALAQLSLGALRDKLALHEQPEPAGGTGEVSNVLLYGDAVANEAEQLEAMGFRVVAAHRSWAAFEVDAFNAMPDAIVMEADALTPETALQIERLSWRIAPVQAIVIYGFAADAQLRAMAAAGIITLRAPAGHGVLARELGRPLPGVSRSDQDDETPAPRRLFSNAELATLSSISAAVQCECPHHLVDIVRTLLRFETYSAECENRNDADAALHRMLARTTGRARAMFEQALIRVAEYEDVPLPPRIRRSGAGGTD